MDTQHLNFIERKCMQLLQCAEFHNLKDEQYLGLQKITCSIGKNHTMWEQALHTEKHKHLTDCQFTVVTASALQEKSFSIRSGGQISTKELLDHKQPAPSYIKVYKASVQLAYQIWLQPPAQGRRPWGHCVIWQCLPATYQANPLMHTFSARNKTLSSQYWRKQLISTVTTWFHHLKQHKPEKNGWTSIGLGSHFYWTWVFSLLIAIHNQIHAAPIKLNVPNEKKGSSAK